MAFLDNSGDIILDAVLTDAGRKRMAEGNFQIAKYAFGDDEINYAQYNKADPRGSAYYDLEIMQTPILEAFTNNTASMSSFLMTLADDSHTHLPVLRLNENWGKVGTTKSLMQHKMLPVGNSITSHTSMSRNTFMAGQAAAAGTNIDSTLSAKFHKGTFVVTCDAATEELFQLKDGVDAAPAWGPAAAGNPQIGCMIPQGVILGSSTNSALPHNKNYICIDQGITSHPSQNYGNLAGALKEDVFMVEADTRFCEIIRAPRFAARDVTDSQVTGPSAAPPSPGAAAAPFSFVDDDFIGTALLEGNDYVSDIINSMFGDINAVAGAPDGISRHDLLREPRYENNNFVQGQIFKDSPVGNRLEFSVRASRALQDSDDLFIRLGSRTKLLSRYLPTPDLADNGFNADVVPYRKLGAGGDVGFTSAFDITSDGDGNDQDDDAFDAAMGDNENRKAAALTQSGRAVPVYYIDTMIRVTGYNFGQSIDIPVRFVKKVEG